MCHLIECRALTVRHMGWRSSCASGCSWICARTAARCALVPCPDRLPLAAAARSPGPSSWLDCKACHRRWNRSKCLLALGTAPSFLFPKLVAGTASMYPASHAREPAENAHPCPPLQPRAACTCDNAPRSTICLCCILIRPCRLRDLVAPVRQPCKTWLDAQLLSNANAERATVDAGPP